MVGKLGKSVWMGLGGYGRLRIRRNQGLGEMDESNQRRQVAENRNKEEGRCEDVKMIND